LSKLVHLGWIDYTIMAAYFALTIAIGFIVKRRVRSSSDYFMAGRAIPKHAIFIGLRCPPWSLPVST